MSRARIVTREVLTVAVLQAVILTTLAAILPTWQDEEFTLATTAHGLGYAIHRALTYEAQAPLYFAVLAILRYLNMSVFFAREFSVATGVATTLVCAWIARRIWPERNPWPFCALVALNFFTAFVGLEIRTYSLALLEGALLVACAIDGFWLGESLRFRLGFALCAIAGLYTQYFIAFDIAALFVALVVLRRFSALPAYVGCVALVLAAFAPLALFVRSQASETLSVEGGGPSGFGGMLLHPSNLVLFHSFTEARSGKLVWIALEIALLAALVLGRPRLDARKWAFVSLFIVVDAIYVVLSDGLKVNFVFPRHFVALFLPESILAYTLVASFTGRFAAASALGVAFVFATTNVITLAQTYRSGAKLGDSARVGALLSRESRPGDAIAVYPGDAVPSVRRYYSGPLPIAGYPEPLDENTYRVDAALVSSKTGAQAAFDRLPRARRLWFDDVGSCDAGNVHGCLYVLAVMKERYRTISERHLYQTDVYELEARAR